MRLITLVFASLLVTSAHADPLDNLNDFYTKVKAFEASFSQVVLNSEGEVEDESTGHVVIDRPNRFYWDYATPFRQEIVSDGQQVWLYDHDLSQVTVRPIAEALAGTPVALLSGVDLEREFVIHAGESGRLQWVDMYPLAEDTDFTRIRLGFKGNAPAQMELFDQFEQVTRITFSEAKVNHKVDSQLFVFRVPDGVEVVGVDD